MKPCKFQRLWKGLTVYAEITTTMYMYDVLFSGLYTVATLTKQKYSCWLVSFTEFKTHLLF